MKAMVLAAGLGTRLRPLTDSLPKALVPVAQRPMIEYSLRLLAHYNIRDVVINLHHHGEQIKQRIGDGHQWGLDIHYSEETELLDTGGGLLKAKNYLNDDTFIVINTDVLIDLRLDALIAFHRRHKAAATLVLRADPEADAFGSMDLDSKNRIHRFLQTHAPWSPQLPIRKLMFTGVQILEPRVFSFMSRAATSPRFSTTKETYPSMLTAGEPLFGYDFEGYWQDLGTVERIQAAETKISYTPGGLHYL